MTPASPAAAAETLTHPLLADGTVALEVAPEQLHLIRRWLPLLPYAHRRPAPRGACIQLAAAPPAVVAPDTTPALRLGTVSAWVSGDRVAMSDGRGSAGRIALDAGSAVLGAADDDAGGWAAYSMATVSLALLLGRSGRALVHAAAPVDPDGRAWLLVGDSHAGKTTTCANLLNAGWRFASDDHVVLGRGDDGRVWVEGLPRYFHLDDGWGGHAPLGRRGETDPRTAFPGRWVERAPLGGILLPRVRAERPTAGHRAGGSRALAALIRQSPWLMMDRAAAPAILEMLREAATLSAFSLELGLDTFADGPRLAHVLAALERAHDRGSGETPGAG